MLADFSKQHHHFSQQMTRFQALFRKSGLAQKMLGESCKICQSPGLFGTKEHLLLVFVAILFDMFDNLEQAEGETRGVQASFSVYNFL